ncbi:hypothetical protein A1O1_05997 [Capronia coronata CBS 617.96]|uniref:DUF541 domain-containing protein n=1 Tax=Capronia coronata CBS 617.96 TaxID=1182541 RepID=W9Y8R0_9EURO|nr:uncharacterized protein A1O1_05997 [Capronia coronata CBS 617.96]EXJ85631.1 hypothetical protein A1O1_05997 [Capronia coronata CBS 617.96]
MVPVPTVIRIEGSATISTLAERAALVVQISDSGYDKDQVSKNVLDTVTNLQAQLDSLCPRLDNGEGDISPTAPVSFYSISSLSTSSRNQRDDDPDDYSYDDIGPSAANKRPHREVFTARTSVDIRFRDFVKLGELVAQLSSTPYVNITGVTWKLTDDTQDALADQARMNALRQTIRRANSYAEVIGRTASVVPVKIEDASQYRPTGRIKQTARKAAAPMSVGGGIDFEPQTMDVTATLDVEFHAE